MLRLWSAVANLSSTFQTNLHIFWLTLTNCVEMLPSHCDATVLRLKTLLIASWSLWQTSLTKKPRKKLRQHTDSHLSLAMMRHKLNFHTLLVCSYVQKTFVIYNNAEWRVSLSLLESLGPRQVYVSPGGARNESKMFFAVKTFVRWTTLHLRRTMAKKENAEKILLRSSVSILVCSLLWSVKGNW